MAAPAALAAFSIGSSLIGGIVQGKAAEQGYQAQSQMYNYQSQVAKINSDIDKQNADYAIIRGEQSAMIRGAQGAQTLAQIKVAQAASGIDVNSGSAADVQASEKKVTAIDMNQIRANAAKTAYDYNVQSVQDLNQSGLYTMASNNASAAGSLAMEASLISTAGNVSSKWLAATQSGALPSFNILS